MTTRLRLGVSACLLGQPVRYDGGHKHDRSITELGACCSFVPVCPEVECGMTVPREPMRLEGDPGNPRLITNRSRVDLTGQVQDYCRAKVRLLEQEELCGFIFKKDSPSCGLLQVKVYSSGMPAKNGSGLFAAAMQCRFPQLPMEEEGRLHDPVIRENFLERLFSYHRLQEFLGDDPTYGRLVAFHAAHKLLLMAHSPQLYRETGRLVANGSQQPLPGLLRNYSECFMRALCLHATVSKHTNVLQHIAGYFKQQLVADEKQELQELISQYHKRQVPLVVPLTLLRHYVRKYGQEYLQGQVYMNPYPAELMLHNHV